MGTALTQRELGALGPGFQDLTLCILTRWNTLYYLISQCCPLDYKLDKDKGWVSLAFICSKLWKYNTWHKRGVQKRLTSTGKLHFGGWWGCQKSGEFMVMKYFHRCDWCWNLEERSSLISFITTRPPHPPPITSSYSCIFPPNVYRLHPFFTMGRWMLRLSGRIPLLEREQREDEKASNWTSRVPPSW